MPKALTQVPANKLNFPHMLDFDKYTSIPEVLGDH